MQDKVLPPGTRVEPVPIEIRRAMTAPKPAECLLGLELPNGWEVTAPVTRTRGATGGTFSVPYLVERSGGGSGQQAFLKALDLTLALGLPMSPVDALRELTAAYGFERDVVMRCANGRMSHVVRGIDAGDVELDPTTLDPTYQLFNRVPYIIFERADGDVRASLAAGTPAFDHAWAFRVAHGVANGLRQLHQVGITHQDIKPSNIMTFGALAKVGDLGRAAAGAGTPPDNEQPLAGDGTYAPPELLYEDHHGDVRYRRMACEAYHLGGILVFLFSGAGLTAQIEAALDPVFHWRTWPRDYRNALPYVRDAYDRVLASIPSGLPCSCTDPLTRIVRELTDPDPLVRGNGRRGTTHQRFSMERYVSILDRLATRAWNYHISVPS